MAHRRDVTRQSLSVDKETDVEEPLKHNEVSPRLVFSNSPIMELDDVDPGPFSVSVPIPGPCLSY